MRQKWKLHHGSFELGFPNIISSPFCNLKHYWYILTIVIKVGTQVPTFCVATTHSVDALPSAICSSPLSQRHKYSTSATRCRHWHQICPQPYHLSTSFTGKLRRQKHQYQRILISLSLGIYMYRLGLVPGLSDNLVGDDTTPHPTVTVSFSFVTSIAYTDQVLRSGDNGDVMPTRCWNGWTSANDGSSTKA